LHPISETHQFSPNLSYLDVLSKNSRPRRSNAEDDEDEGPPPDPDDPQPAQPLQKKVEKASASNAKEVTVTARRAGESSEDLGGLSSLRRELILKRRKERDETWQALEWHDKQVRLPQSISARIDVNGAHGWSF
jgi:DNA-directed RNA polymerase-3 subunit RPC5